jgi:dienelactone hydrolase
MNDPLNDFELRPLSFADMSYDVYVAGSGPAVVVLPEIPGITPQVADFARRVIDAGFTVWVASLFGTPGKAMSDGYAVKTIAGQCVRKGFLAFARSQRAPITQWMSGLVTHAHAECGGKGVGVVGMCFTGNFALALAVDPAVLVPVMSQPSMPFGITAKHRADLHVHPDDLATVKQRTVDDDLCVIGLRFTGDPLVPAERFARLRGELGDAFIGVEIDSTKGNPHGFGIRSHSVLTTEYRPEPEHPTSQAHELVLDHFRQKLLA